MLAFTNQMENAKMEREAAAREPFTERQKQIMDASLKLIAEEGIVAFTTKKLANAVNISEPALYRHFENKEDILSQLIIYLHEQIEEIFNSFDQVKNKSA